MSKVDCQFCFSRRVFKVLDLGLQPPSDYFLSETDLNKKEPFKPLQIFLCEECKLVQLGNVVEPKILFGNHYVYMSGYSKSLKTHLQSLAVTLVNMLKLKRNDLAIDIGSNDGTLLEGYLPYGIRVLGVEPSGIADVSLRRGIPAINTFFNEKTAKAILKKYGKAKVITATNVFAHVNKLHSFVKGVKLLMDDYSVFVVESHYLLNLIKNLEYDSIYHEHLRYYSLYTLIKIFDYFNLDVFHAEQIPTHGGSIRVFVCNKEAREISGSIKSILNLEKKHKLHTRKTFEDFKKRVFRNREDLKKLLLDIKSKNNRIVGIGAPAKSTTLLNFCRIGKNIIDYLVETNELKIGKFSPGTRIKIVDESLLFEEQPEYALLLSWNLKDDLIPKLRKNGYKGRIIVPIPEPTIADA